MQATRRLEEEIQRATNVCHAAEPMLVCFRIPETVLWLCLLTAVFFASCSNLASICGCVLLQVGTRPT